MAPTTDATVVQVTSSVAAALIHFGPAGNARALPGGDGSSDDETSLTIGPTDDTVTFQDDVENAAAGADIVDVFVANAATLPPGVAIACTDTSGTPLPASSRPGGFALGALAAGLPARARCRPRSSR